MTFFRSLFADDRGIATIEYAVIAMLLGTSLIASFQNLGNEVSSSFDDLTNHMVEANTGS